MIVTSSALLSVLTGARLPSICSSWTTTKEAYDVLEDLSKTHKFSINYVSLPRTPTNLDDDDDETDKDVVAPYQVLLQLGTVPVAVVHGLSNDTEETARCAAAYRALQYLAVMTNSTVGMQLS